MHGKCLHSEGIMGTLWNHTPASLVTRSPYSAGQPSLSCPYTPTALPRVCDMWPVLVLPILWVPGRGFLVLEPTGTAAQLTLPFPGPAPVALCPPGSVMLLVTDRTSKLPSELGACWLMMRSEFGGGRICASSSWHHNKCDEPVSRIFHSVT